MKSILPCLMAGIPAFILFISLPASAEGLYFPAIAGVIPAADTNRPAKQGQPSLVFATTIRRSEEKRQTYSYASVYERAEDLKVLAASRANNTEYAILVDLNMASGQKRCFVVDLESMTIVKYGVVAADGDAQPSAALGIYTIGKQLNATVYTLNAVQKTENNTLKPAMLLQSSEAIPDNDIVFPLPVTNDGLSISPAFFAEISKTTR